MLKILVISLLCDDRPGIVESLANAIADHQGNWLESQLAQLAGKFAGVVRVQISEDQEAALRSALNQLGERKIQIFIEEDREAQSTHSGCRRLSFRATGPDRPGIVREISHALAQYDINLEKLDTQLSSMAYSGDPLFEAWGVMAVPSALGYNDLADRLDEVANELAMDIVLEEE